MTSTLPFLALGVANLLRQRQRRPAAWSSPAWSALLLLVCLWGAMTAQLYRGGVQDLGPVFLGRPSAGATEAQASVLDPDTARRALRFPVSFRLPKYLEGQPLLGRLLAAALMAAALVLAVGSAGRRRSGGDGDSHHHGALLAAAAVLALATAFHLRLATGPRADQGERANWRKFASAAAAPTPDHALLDREMGRFEEEPAASADRGDPYRYLYLWSLWQRNRAGRAHTQLEALAARGYPAAAALVELGQGAGPNGTIRLALPGVLMGRADSELRLRLRGERALFVRRLVVTAEVTLQEPAAGRRPLVAILAGPTVIARLDLLDGDSVVATPAVELSAPAGWSGRQTLRFTWDGPNEEALAEMGRGTKFGPPVTAPGAAPASYTDDELAVALAPQSGSGGSGIVIANLFIATASRERPFDLTPFDSAQGVPRGPHPW